jgi:hypothetical protein
MSWAIGYDDNWKRDIGYGVPAICDHPGCGKKINRGLSYVCCNEEPYGGDGCGLYFCGDHLTFDGCSRCENKQEPFKPTPDVAEWINWKLTDESWQQWRNENPAEVMQMRESLSEMAP